jgi:transposase-like protein
MYIRGMSTRDIEQTFTDSTGKTYLSKSSVSRLNEKMYEEYEKFNQRELSEIDAVYLFVEGVYESVRRYTSNQTLLCAWCICSDGTKQLLGISAVGSESSQSWEMFFEEMIKRGLRQPLLIVSDGGKGAASAIAKSFPKSDRQRCLAHKLRNISTKLPKDRQVDMLAGVKEVYYAADYDKSKILAG